MITFESEEEVLEFLELMNLKAVDMMIGAILSSVKRVQTPEGDVEPLELSCDGFNKCFGGTKMAIERLKIGIVKNPRITSEYGYREHPVTGEKHSWHNGVDLVGSDTRLLGIHDGEIIEVGSDDTAGNWIKVRYLINGAEFIFSYCHLAKPLSPQTVGHIVYKGEWIGIMGATGRATAVHLHLTVRRNGIIVDPLIYFEFV